MINEPFATGDSPLHTLDPRVKLVAVTIFTMVVAVTARFPSLVAALVISAGLLFSARLDGKEVLRRLVLINAMVVFFWLLLPVTVPGIAIGQLGPLTVTREGVLLAFRLTIKSNAIILAFIALLATSSIATVGQAMGRLKVPTKLVQLLLLTYRYIFVIEEEYRTLSRAAAIRGFSPKTNLHTYKTYAHMVGILFVRASLRADRVHQAMRCRGFTGHYHALHQFNFTNHERLWSLVLITAIMIIGGLEWLAG